MYSYLKYLHTAALNPVPAAGRAVADTRPPPLLYSVHRVERLRTSVGRPVARGLLSPLLR